MGELPPPTLTTTKVQCEGCSTRLGSWLIVVALMPVTGSAPLVLCAFKILFLFRFSHTLFLIGQHTLHNVHLLLTAVRVTDYYMCMGAPIFTRHRGRIRSASGINPSDRIRDGYVIYTISVPPQNRSPPDHQ